MKHVFRFIPLRGRHGALAEMVTEAGGAGSPLSLEYRKQRALSAFTEIVRAPEPPPATSCGCTTTRPPPSTAKGTGTAAPEAFSALTAPLRPPAASQTAVHSAWQDVS